jgi:hypothetical protein
MKDDTNNNALDINKNVGRELRNNITEQLE